MEKEEPDPQKYKEHVWRLDFLTRPRQACPQQFIISQKIQKASSYIKTHSLVKPDR